MIFCPPLESETRPNRFVRSIYLSVLAKLLRRQVIQSYCEMV